MRDKVWQCQGCLYTYPRNVEDAETIQRILKTLSRCPHCASINWTATTASPFDPEPVN